MEYYRLIKTNADFQDFISLKINRLQFIQDYLKKGGADSFIIDIKEKKHIFVKFPQKQYNPVFRTKTVIAHYDRIPDGEGANDNSFAVFFLMNWAINLLHKPLEHNIRLIFTDGEENGTTIKDLGAFDLASYFKKNQMSESDIFVFDCMGRGNIPVLCQTSLPTNLSESFKNDFIKLEQRTQKILSSSSDKWITLPTSYSDNAGFLASGIPAVTITMLPSREADNYMKLLMKTKSDSISQVYKPEHKEDLKLLFPLTWFLINSTKDTKDTLSYEGETVFEKILDNIVKLKTLV